MKAEFWLQKWQKKDIGFNQAEPNVYLQRYISKLNLKATSTIFVPLCGKSIDMVWLAAQGYHVIGIELSLEACKAFYTENGIDYKANKFEDFTVFTSERITIYCGDLFLLDSKNTSNIDAIYDRAALIALPDETRKKYADKLLELSPSNSKILLITMSYDQKEMSGPPFSVDSNEIKSLYHSTHHIETLVSKEIIEIPQHLQDKGLKTAFESASLLTKKQ